MWLARDHLHFSGPPLCLWNGFLSLDWWQFVQHSFVFARVHPGGNTGAGVAVHGLGHRSRRCPHGRSTSGDGQAGGQWRTSTFELVATASASALPQM